MKKCLIQVVIILAMAAGTGLFVNYFRHNKLNIEKDWSIQARMTTRSGKSLVIPLKNAEKLFIDKKALFIDARSRQEYLRAHIKGAINLPWHDIDDKFMEIAPKLSSDKMIITYCDGQTCNLSLDLAKFLIDAGFDRVKILVNGFSAWEKAGMPVNTAPFTGQ